MDFNNKGKTKVIALLSSIVLWLYVTTVVDPLESKTFKDMPVTISNSHLIKENNLEIFPEETITVDVTVKTNLSKLKRLTRDNIIVFGSVSNPMPGRNVISLSTNLPDSIRHDINQNTATIQLESVENIKKDVTVIANKKYTTDKYKITIDKEFIEVSGTKTLVNKIDKVVGTLKSTDKEDSFMEKVELIPIDKNGNKVEGIKLSDKYINVNVEEIVVEPIVDPNLQTVEQEKKDKEPQPQTKQTK